MNKIYVVGIGPGQYEKMTIEAAEIIRDCDVIIGYTVYIKLIEKYFKDKEFLTTPMKQEISRCRLAFDEAKKGRKTAVICSGDSGVYGMAGLMYELLPEYPDCEIEVVAGVTAALSGAAVLGAPLIHDFCLISLSDLLTPWEKIEKRLLCAAEADFVICIYNPSSKKRADHLMKACDIIMRYASGDTVCAVISNIAREGECSKIMTLAELRNIQTDMFTTVFIGNSQTVVVNGKIVTPRGYEH